MPKTRGSAFLGMLAAPAAPTAATRPWSGVPPLVEEVPLLGLEVLGQQAVEAQ